MNKYQIKRNACEIIQLAQLDNWYDYESMDSDSTLESVFLGTVFNIMPSGKYYMPFACSNVDSCPRCHGSGNGKKIICSHCKGLTYRTVSEIAAIRKESYSQCFDFLHKNSTYTWITHGCFECNVCSGTGITHESCAYCDGMGSREAHEDNLMNEYLESFAADFNCYLEFGEGDPCDMYLVREKIDTEAN